MTTTGVVTSVTPTYRGDTLAAATTATDLLLLVEDAGDFAEEDDFVTGEHWLVIGDSGPIQYVDTDMDADTITLANPVGAAYEEGLPVRLWDPTVPPAGAPVVEYLAYIQLADETGTLAAAIPHELIPLAGVDNLVGAFVEIVETDTQQWEVRDVLGREPIIDGSMIDPDTMPTTEPSEPPATSPAVTVHGVANGLVLTAETVEPGTLIEYHLTATPPVDAEGEPLPFDPSPDTLIGEPTRSTIVVVTDLPIDGTPLQPDTPYYVRTLARNAVGPATGGPSPMVSGLLDLDNVSELIAAKVEAGYVLAGSITVGQITIDPDSGITIPTADGGITLPADGTEAEFTGAIRTGSIQIENNLTINGRQNAINGELVLANLIVAPPEGPSLGWQWPWYTTLDPDIWSLTDSPDTSEWVTLDFYTNRIYRYRKVDGVKVGDTPSPAGYPLVSITRIGGYYYGAAFNGTDLVVVKLDAATFAVVGEYVATGAHNVSKRPGLGVDESGNLLVAWGRNGGVDVRVHVVDPVTLARLDSLLIDYVEVTSDPWDVLGIMRQYAPDGVTLEWTMSYGGGLYRHTGLVADPKLQGPEAAKGLHWDGERMWTLGWTSYRVWKWSTSRWTDEPDVQFTWYDDDPLGTGVHETPPSPITSFRPPANSYLRMVAPQPADSGDPDSPNAIRVYIDGHLQATPDTWLGYLIFDAVEQSGVAPPTTNSFENAAPSPGSLTSTAVDGTGDPIIRLSGDGSGRVGPYEWDATGTSESFDDFETRLSFLETPGPWNKVGTTGNPNYQNGFSAWGSDGTKYRVNQAGDMLTITGDVSIPGNVSNGDVVFTLPTGFRPAIDVNNMFGWQNSSGVKFCLINVGANGQVTWWTGGNSPGGRSIFTVHVPLG